MVELRARAEEYEAAKARVVTAKGVEHHVADAERARAWSLLLEAHDAFVKAEQVAPETATGAGTFRPQSQAGMAKFANDFSAVW